MEFTYTEKDLTSRENFLTAAGQFYNLYEQAKREEEERLRLAKERDFVLDEAIAKIEEFLRLFWRVENSEDEEVLYYTLKLLRKELIDLAAIGKTEDGIKDTGDGVWVGHHTLTKSNKSNDSAKCNDSTKSNKPIEADKAIKPAHGEIKFKRFNEPITLTAHSDKPVNLDLLPLINDKPATLKPIEEDELTKQLSKIINNLFEKPESTNQLDKLIDKLMK